VAIVSNDEKVGQFEEILFVEKRNIHIHEKGSGEELK